jgi:class 3 adenylate cyclase
MNYDIELKERYLAIVLLDLIGSTAFVQKAGALKSAKWLQYHDRLARSIMYRFNGREIDRSDGFLLSFERTIDAVNFALHYQKNVPQKIKLNARIGIHFGKIVEVKQDELLVGVGAKKIELEGINKNITARVMSLCEKGQVLLTKEAVKSVKNRTNAYTPKSTRFACVGIYKFKGVREPMQVYAVGETIESLQPPKGSEKVKRLGGPKYIKSKLRDKKFKEWVQWIFWRLGFISTIYWIIIIMNIILVEKNRIIFGINHYPYREISDFIKSLFIF